MELEFTDEDLAFRDELRAWLDENITAADDEYGWHRRLVADRWAVPNWPRQWGGREATLTQELVYQELMGEFDAPVPRNSIGLFNIGPMLMEHGTPGQQERYLPPMVTAEEIWCQGFSEPAAGSDLAALTTRAEDRGDHWLVNGQKVWNTFGDEADLCLALCRTDPDAPKHRGISALIIDMSHPGVEVRPLREITGDDGFNEIFLTDVEVPKDQVVGPVGGGWKVAMSTLLYERLGTMKLGIQLRRRLEQVTDLARELGRDRDAVTRDHLARLAVEVDLMQLLTHQAVVAMQRGDDPGAALPFGKLQWSELMQQLPELALDLQGPLAQLYRDPRHDVPGNWGHQTLYSRMTTIGAGTTQVQKNILAYRVLGLPRHADDEPRPVALAEDRLLTEEQRGLRDTVRRLLTERCPTSWVREQLDSEYATTPDVWQQMAQLGLMGLLVPQQYGGLGLGLDEAAPVLEELGRALHPGPYLASAVTSVLALQHVATEEQQAELLPPIADGTTLATLALHEPEQGHDWRHSSVKAVPDGAHWRLEGTKLFVPDGCAADLLLVTAAGDAGIGLFAVDRRQAGDTLTTTPLRTLDPTRPQAELTLDRAPAQLLGASDAASTLRRAVDRIMTVQLLDGVGAAHQALLVATEYAKVRVQFDQPIGSFQAVQHLLADMLRHVELSRAGALAAARAAARENDVELHRAVVAARAYASEALCRTTADAIQVLGGIGFTWEHDAHLYYKRTLSLRHAWGGPTEMRAAYASLLLDDTDGSGRERAG